MDVGLQPLVPASDLGISTAKLSKEIERQRSMSWRNQGSARTLEGLVCVKHVFVDDTTSSWTVPGRRDVRDYTTLALNHLREEALARGIELLWREREASQVSDKDVPTSVSNHSWTKDVLQSAYVKEGVYLPRASCQVRECDQEMAIIHVNKEGRSFAVPSVASADREVERVVMFMRKRQLQFSGEEGEQAFILLPEYPASYVHEVLHLFGARDMYEPEARMRAAAIRYPQEVMLQSSRSLSGVEISDYTAYYVGWNDEVPPALPPEW